MRRVRHDDESSEDGYSGLLAPKLSRRAWNWHGPASGLRINGCNWEDNGLVTHECVGVEKWVFGSGGTSRLALG